MEWNFSQLLSLFSDSKSSRLLLKGNFGLEKESQRVTPSGDLALTPHPSTFGDKLKNPNITTDFSESQLELITPPLGSVEEVYEFLKNLQKTVENGLENHELLWPLSMPPRLPDEDIIPIAKFNDTEKDTYRRGLALRYSKKMQMISGLHYNFSFSNETLDFLFKKFGAGSNKQAFINDLYFALARNYLRYRWLLIYLFGASPTTDYTFYSALGKQLKTAKKCCPECCSLKKYDQYATSLRVSRFGYSSSIQQKYNISYNSLKEHILAIRTLMKTPSRNYAKLGTIKDGQMLQLNTNVLQKESEFYSSIRFKQNLLSGETQLNALEQRGVKYLEVRVLDLNPFEKLSISLNELYFLQVFMLFCLFEKSDFIYDMELKKINKNHHLAALSGRKPNLMLYDYESNKKVLLRNWGNEIFEKLNIIARLLDQGTKDNKYQLSILKEKEKLSDPSLLPSSLIYNEMKDKSESYLDFGIRRAITSSKNYTDDQKILQCSKHCCMS